ncbi:3218_t:CDS:2 [Gigaspora margarita]|uniref:3218_t:CDS:1 n=1 Tax=Gigaspora margarita TaxID=4874 RepID=A0ABN7VYI3_GIGMA|nr:3218_t:CDS:2 [Gigaspora margarita]
MSNDKRKKEWILFKESSKTEKEQSRSCLLQRNFKSNKKAIDKKLIRKSNEKGEHKERASHLIPSDRVIRRENVKRVLKGKEVINKLLTITKKLIRKRQLEVYTDGSMINSKKGLDQTRLGAE